MTVVIIMAVAVAVVVAGAAVAVAPGKGSGKNPKKTLQRRGGFPSRLPTREGVRVRVISVPIDTSPA